jgi:hypothetical protein
VDALPSFQNLKARRALRTSAEFAEGRGEFCIRVRALAFFWIGQKPVSYAPHC